MLFEEFRHEPDFAAIVLCVPKRIMQFGFEGMIGLGHLVESWTKSFSIPLHQRQGEQEKQDEGDGLHRKEIPWPWAEMVDEAGIARGM